MMWMISAGLVLLWAVLTFVLHKGGYVHIIVIGAISIFVVTLIGYRKAQYHKRHAGDR
jgi:uncharacterized membrane protein